MRVTRYIRHTYMEDNIGVEVLVCLEDRDRILFLEIRSLFSDI